MPFEIKYESDFYKIEVDVEDARLLKAKWLRPVDEKEMETGGTKLFEILRDTKVEKAIANAQALGALSPGAKQWMSTTFYELLSQTELRRIARVLPENLFHKLALESVVLRAKALGLTTFKVKNFLTEDEALEWLTKT